MFVGKFGAWFRSSNALRTNLGVGLRVESHPRVGLSGIDWMLRSISMHKKNSRISGTRVRDHLVLDHFYLTLEERQIQALRQLENLISRCYYSATTAGNRSWAGLYIYTNIGSYFEMIPNRKVPRLAFAFRTGPNDFVDCRKMRTELPHLPWQGGKTLWRKTKKVWFNWLDTKLKVGFENSEIGAWMMHYPSLHEPNLRAAKQRASLERFKSIAVEMSPKARGTLIELSRWMPGKLDIGKRSASLAFKDRDYGDFVVEIAFRKGAGEGARLRKIVAHAHEDLKPFRLRAIDLEVISRRGQLIIQMR